METLRKRWNKISDKGKKHHMYLGASLYRNVPLVAMVIIMMELINKYRHVSISYLAINFSIKILLAYVIGVYIGYLEWGFLEKLIGGKFKNNRSFRLTYIYTYGVWFFGTTMMLANINTFFVDSRRNIIAGIVYLLSGLLWGGLMSTSINREIVE